MSRETCTPNDVQVNAAPARRRSAREPFASDGTPPQAVLTIEVARVKDMIRGMARLAPLTRPPTLALVAQRLFITPRTLQRRLRDSGTSFRSLLNDARLELAAEQLDSHGKVADAAHAAGFSEPACFHRAFKRWTGKTPKRFTARGS